MPFHRPNRRTLLVTAGLAGLAAGTVIWRDGPAGGPSSSAVRAAHLRADPVSCASCHGPEYRAWEFSHHALAETALSAADPPYPAAFAHPERWIGVAPLKQLLISTGDGRLQASDQAFDPAKHEWFGVFGSDVRLPGEWGHWTGRGMNWNSECAYCHNTGVEKNYQPATDSYATVVAHQGITCAACHGAASQPLSRAQAEEICATCHARRSELTGAFHPGDSFSDHFSLLIVDDTDAYYADGQVKEEDFEYAAFLGSKMHAAGVTCLDCHDPHRGSLVASGNMLCMRCHGTGNLKAPLINPEMHSHHLAGSAGDLCVNCHMPVTMYMQRHARRDHGFTIPDPLLTQKTGEPNACNRCHTGENAAWALAAAVRWYGPKLERPTRERALMIAAARNGDAAAEPALRAILRTDAIPYWRAVAAGLLANWAEDPVVETALTTALHDGDPLVRAYAARALAEAAEAGREEASQALAGALNDPSRSVRIEAAWGRREEIDLASRAGQELKGFLEFNRDQPSGAYQLGVFDFSRNELSEATTQFENAVRWDSLGTPQRSALAVAYSLGGRPADAAAQLREACRLAPTDAQLQFQLGLALNETGDRAGALAALARATELDPTMANAWYNLAVAYYQAGDRDRALKSAQEALRRDPGMEKARQLVELAGRR